MGGFTWDLEEAKDFTGSCNKRATGFQTIGINKFKEMAKEWGKKVEFSASFKKANYVPKLRGWSDNSDVRFESVIEAPGRVANNDKKIKIDEFANNNE